MKIYGADTGRFGNSRDGVERFWRNVFGGHASARFHRPESGLGLGKTARKMIAGAREVTGAIDVFSCEPRNDLLGRRETDEAYCLASPGKQYAVYFPRAGEVTLNAQDAPGRLSVRWYDIDHGRWADADTVPGGRIPQLKTPGSGQWAVVIRKAES